MFDICTYCVFTLFGSFHDPRRVCIKTRFRSGQQKSIPSIALGGDTNIWHCLTVTCTMLKHNSQVRKLSLLLYLNVLHNSITKTERDRLVFQQHRLNKSQLHPTGVSQTRISFKTLVFVFISLHGLCPQYINGCLTVSIDPIEREGQLTRRYALKLCALFTDREQNAMYNLQNSQGVVEHNVFQSS